MIAGITKTLLLFYANVPTEWEDLNFSSTPLSKVIQVKYQQALDKMPNNARLFVFGCVAPVFNHLFSKEVGCTGIDFAQYFNDCLSEGAPRITFKQTVFVYNVGYERAVKKDFPKQILTQLLNSVKQAGSSCVVQTDLTDKEFSLAYGLEIKNKMSIPYPEEEKFI